MTPRQVADEYRRRFGIETSYRLMNTLRTRTTSTSAPWRLFLVALALLLLNLWTYITWQFLFGPQTWPTPSSALPVPSGSLAYVIMGGYQTTPWFLSRDYPSPLLPDCGLLNLDTASSVRECIPTECRV